MIGAGVATGTMQLFAPDVKFPFTLLFIVPISMLGAAIGTFAFAAEPRNVLVAFATRVRPPGPGWIIPRDLPSEEPASGLPVIVDGDEDHQSPERQRRVTQMRNAERSRGTSSISSGRLIPPNDLLVDGYGGDLLRDVRRRGLVAQVDAARNGIVCSGRRVRCCGWVDLSLRRI